MNGLVKFENQELGSKYIESIQKKFHLDESDIITHFDPDSKKDFIEEMLK